MFLLDKLLHVVKGPSSFAHFKTIEGVNYNTYQAACKEIGCQEDDSQCYRIIIGSSSLQFSKLIEDLFAIVVAFCQVTNSVYLWNKYQENLVADILISRRQGLLWEDVQYDQNIFDESFLELNKVVELLSGKSINGFGLPMHTNIRKSL